MKFDQRYPEKTVNLVGVISDTHGLLRPEAYAALQGCDLILHAGDIGKISVLDTLGKIAPVVAVRGNVDSGSWADVMPWNQVLDIAGHRVLLLHNIADLAADAEPSQNYDAIVYGHSHQARNDEEDGVLYFNPGSAGPRRFKLPVTVGRLRLNRGKLESEIIDLGF